MSRIKGALALGVLLAALGATAEPAAAATCSDYSNQAEAQRAADTIDADGDGIYCESLPCPCLKPGDPSPPPTGPPTTEPGLAGERIRARVVSVTDGDTLKVQTLTGRRLTVRLVGIDAPETVDPGKPVECGGPRGGRPPH